MPKLPAELNSRLQEARSARGLTQQQLAVAVSVSRQTINVIEQGQYNPSTVLALRLAYVLHTTIEDLFQLPQTALQSLDEQRQHMYHTEEK